MHTILTIFSAELTKISYNFVISLSMGDLTMVINSAAYSAYLPPTAQKSVSSVSAEVNLLDEMKTVGTKQAVNLAIFHYSQNASKATAQGLDLYNFTVSLFGQKPASEDSLLQSFDPQSQPGYLQQNSVNLLV